MTLAASRSRLIQLREELRSTAAGRELLDRKREAVVRALTERVRRRDALLKTARTRLDAARSALADADLDLGRAAVSAAALAQPPLAGIDVRTTSAVGVPIPIVTAEVGLFRPHYGPASGSPALDAAGDAFTAALPPLCALAAEETAVRRLRAALARTARRVNALDTQVLPALAREVRALTASLEEDERDEAVRRKQWLARSAVDENVR